MVSVSLNENLKPVNDDYPVSETSSEFVGIVFNIAQRDQATLLMTSGGDT